MGGYDKEKALKKKIRRSQKKKQEIVKAKVEEFSKNFGNEVSSLSKKISDSEEESNDLNSDAATTQSFPPSGQLDSVLTDKEFSSLPCICDKTKKALSEIGYRYMTEVQAKCIPLLVNAKSLKGTAKTGSGKTLAFLIPLIELVYQVQFKRRNGTGAIVISPTRELAMQTYEVLTPLMKYHSQNFALVIGGGIRQNEAEKLYWGANIVVCTPSRLLDHLQNTEGFIYRNNKMVVIDEADRTVDGKFMEDLKKVFQILPPPALTALFSATKSSKTERLASLLLKQTFIDIDVEKNKPQATVSTLTQSYLVCTLKQKFLVFYTFLKSKMKHKILVFFNSCNTVNFFYHLFNYMNLPCTCIHGQQKQDHRKRTFFQFSNKDSGVLLCTSIAARGIDIPAVDWVVQFDPPFDHEDYIHRVGRTARAGSTGNSLIFLNDDEITFVLFLKRHGINMNRLVFEYDELPAYIQTQYEEKIASDKFMRRLSKDAYRGYLEAYRSHSWKHIFDYNLLKFKEVAELFGLENPPHIDHEKPKKKFVKRIGR